MVVIEHQFERLWITLLPEDAKTRLRNLEVFKYFFLVLNFFDLGMSEP